MTAPDPTVYDVWTRVMPQQLDEGESPDISIGAVVAAAREIDPGAWERAVRDAGWVPREATPDAAGRTAPGEGEETPEPEIAALRAKLAAIETKCRADAMVIISGDPDPVVGVVAVADILDIIDSVQKASTGDGEPAEAGS